MLLRRIKNKQFDYQPRYYDPSKDEALRSSRRIRFERRTRRGRHRPMVWTIGLLILTWILYSVLS